MKANKALTIILATYFDNIDIFLFEQAAKLLKYIGINNYAIKLKDSK